MNLIYAVFESLWRRAFGSGNFNRTILHLINVAVTAFFFWFIGISWIRVLLSIPVFEFLFWSLGHGAAFDIGRSGYPDAEMIKRYERFFWDKWCKIIVPKQNWYGFWYDYLWMCFRYMLPAVLVSIIIGNAYFGYSGFLIATTYAICWNLYDIGKLKILSPTEFAEYLSGFIAGFLLLL